ncbi:MAG: hypothetical protein DWG80_04945 [Chloroflexi bacterium]|nr:hypothetical protein [Chloroflexota bacterium]
MTVPRASGMSVVVLLLAAFGVLMTSVSPPTTHAQAVAVVDQRVVSPDPRAITFEIQVSGAPLSEAVLVHQRANPSGPIGGEIRAELPSRGTGLIQAELVTNGPNVYIPVGTQFTYHWQLRGQDGSVIETEPQEFVFLDGQFQWRSIEGPGVTVYYYDDEVRAARIGEAAADTAEDVGRLLGIEFDVPITVILWGGGRDGRFGLRSRGGVYSENSITGGARVAPDIVHVYTVLTGITWEDVLRHEIGHVMVGRAGEGPFARVPSWLDEGVATYAQVEKGSRQLATEFAIQTDTTLRLRNMMAATNRADLIDLFYGQSWYTVEYMIETYGEEQFAAVFAAIRAGNPIDEALIDVYGIDQDELYNDWRESVGMSRVELVVTSSEVARPDATRAPLSIPTSVTGGSGTTPSAASGAADAGAPAPAVDEAGSSNMTTAIIIGAIALLLAGALGGLGLKLMRSKS